MLERFVRFQRGFGRLVGDRVEVLEGSLFGDFKPTSEVVALDSVHLLAPCEPTKVIGIGSNYRKHAEEMGKAIPDVPKIFLKPSTSVVGTGEAIVIPPETVRVDHEAELGVVIARRCHRVPAERALDVVFGYTACNDITARDFQRADGVFTRGKGFDSFCPLGPTIVRGIKPGDLRVQARVNGELRQDGRTSDMIFSVEELVAFVSSVMTLLPGDVISTGTPSGVGPLRHGDVVEVEVESVGTLHNPVRNRDDRT